jgi:hypothetical protein
MSKRERFDIFLKELKVVHFAFKYDSESRIDLNDIKDGVDTVFFGNDISLLHYHLGYYRTPNNLVRIISVESGDFSRIVIISTFDNNGNLLNRAT